MYAIGNTYTKFRKHFFAIYWFKKVLRQDNATEYIYHRLAKSYIVTEQYKKAEDLCLKYF